ncbi:hypothetical protein [Dapis sp. BLCC M172]|uniref:hypothetical protein n=1 Tax=Dapis sp. BLCC M172 TaxID=2975281 RepID=UPI003CEC80F6
MRELPLIEKKRIDEQENFYLLSLIQGEALNHNISVKIIQPSPINLQRYMIDKPHRHN